MDPHTLLVRPTAVEFWPIRTSLTRYPATEPAPTFHVPETEVVLVAAPPAPCRRRLTPLRQCELGRRRAFDEVDIDERADHRQGRDDHDHDQDCPGEPAPSSWGHDS